MIVTTIEGLLAMKPILQKLANTSMPARDAFKILKTLKLVDKEYESIELVQRKMIDSYGARNEDNTFITDERGNIVIKQESIDQYMAEMQNFFKETIELNCDKLKFELIDSIELTPAQMLNIEEFMEE